MNDLFLKLREKFPSEKLEWRIGQSGLKKDGEPWAKALCYIDARAIQDRLDDVVGPENWKTSFQVTEHGILCHLSIRHKVSEEDVCGEWISKCDGSPETQIEAFKGGLSKALVRAASQWGVGRYLYDIPETFVDCTFERHPSFNYAKDSKSGKVFYWRTPAVPPEFLPGGGGQAGNNSNINSTNLTPSPLTKDDWLKMKDLGEANGWTSDQIKDLIINRFGLESLTDLSRSQYDVLVGGNGQLRGVLEDAPAQTKFDLEPTRVE